MTQIFQYFCFNMFKAIEGGTRAASKVWLRAASAKKVDSGSANAAQETASYPLPSTMVLCFSAHALHIPTLFSDSKQIFRFPIKVLAWKPTEYPQLHNYSFSLEAYGLSSASKLKS